MIDLFDINKKKVKIKIIKCSILYNTIYLYHF